MRIDEIKKIRRSVGLTQEEFGKELGLSRTCIFNWENKIKEPSPSSIRKLLKFCEYKGIVVDKYGEE